MASQPPVVIQPVASKCRSTFAKCDASPLLAQQAWFRAAKAEFNLWCANIKAEKSDKSSLDHRLESRSEVREDICNLLRGLGTSLETCHELVERGSHDISDTPEDIGKSDRHPERNADSALDESSWEAMSYESDYTPSLDEEAASPLAESISYVKTILNQLSRVSLAIRKAGNRYRFERIDASLDSAAFEDFRTHLTTVILRACEDPESQHLPSTTKAQRVSDYGRLKAVQKRMVEADVRRRNRIFSFAASKRDQEAVVATLNQDEPGGQTGMAKKTESDQPSTVVNTATAVGSNLDIKKTTGKPSSSLFTSVTRIGASMQYPPYPESASEQPPRCPYCGDALPREISDRSHENIWRSHVTDHLSPYTCVVAECAEPDELYVTSQALLDHTIQQHSTTCWVCDFCPIDEAPVFTTMGSWNSHIAAKHAENVPSTQRVIIGDLSKKQMLGPLDCPLCDFSASGQSTVVDDHILQHLHEFALRALPPTETPETEGKSGPSKALESHPQHQNHPDVTFDVINRTMDATWHLFVINKVPRPRPLLKRPSFSSTAAQEIWMFEATRVLTLLKPLEFETEKRPDQYLQTIYEDATRAIEKMNRNPESSSIAMSKSEKQDASPSSVSKGAVISQPQRQNETTSSATQDVEMGGGSSESRGHVVYKIEHSGKWTPGAVFETRAGQEWMYPKNLILDSPRFIVAATSDSNSTCIPILTYGGQGCKEPGVDPEQHGIIYTKGSQPHQPSDEPDMGIEPVALDMSVSVWLPEESRVNYSKLANFEHLTHEVCFIGHIVEDDLEIVGDAVDTCSFNKIRDLAQVQPTAEPSRRSRLQEEYGPAVSGSDIEAKKAKRYDDRNRSRLQAWGREGGR